MSGYTRWSRHGELLIDHDTIVPECSNDEAGDHLDNDSCDGLDDMLHDLEDNVAEKYHQKFQQLFEDSEKPLYVGCTKFTKLSAVLKFLNLKANDGWSDKSFTSLLEILHEMLPEENELPISLYQAKKHVCSMGLEIETMFDSMLETHGGNKVNKCAFISPSEIQATIYESNGEDVVSYIVDAMRFHKDKQFFVAPYWQGLHWMLLVICPNQGTGYILDSQKNPDEKPVENYIVVKYVEEVVARLKEDTDTTHPNNWTLVEVCCVLLNIFVDSSYCLAIQSFIFFVEEEEAPDFPSSASGLLSISYFRSKQRERINSRS
ncbi:unnamed protein product [Lactuca virosa]|uniref:Ubiquitin-like protease family profile domain-containing protein n=1 Tax=Lactuca virosa TaxID=75947 RepID=A0AAU9P261_9ASTR|nr:unnamed protein product [Lactuca virosa]